MLEEKSYLMTLITISSYSLALSVVAFFVIPGIGLVLGFASAVVLLAAKLRLRRMSAKISESP